LAELEFDDCVYGCLARSGRGLTLESAIACLDDIPEPLQQHSAFTYLKEIVQNTLVDGVDKLDKIYNMEGRNQPEDEQELLSNAGDALAKLLGPVDGLFVGSAMPHDSLMYVVSVKFNTSFQLNDFVLNFPEAVIRALLQSDALQVHYEDETYYFLLAWLFPSYTVLFYDLPNRRLKNPTPLL